jgi:16S rRNA (guanine527-N7)-methyltransferase
LNPIELLTGGSAALGVSLTADQGQTLLRYLAELRHWNQKIRLTGIRDEKEWIVKHLLDSLSYTRGFVPVKGMRVMDVGAGAGLPGIPLKVCFPDLSLFLVESSHKKSAFLHHAVRVLGLSDVTILTERVEALPERCPQLKEGMDLMMARALAPTDLISKWVHPLLKTGGRFLISKGPEIAFEKAAFLDGRPIGGFFVREIISLTLPYSDYRRNIVVMERGASEQV